MKRFFGLAVLLVLASLPAFAAENSQNVNFPMKVTVGSKQLPKGEYKVIWTGPNSNLNVKIEENGKTLVSAPAKLVPANNSDFGQTALDTRNVNGTHILNAIMFSKFNLVIKKSNG